MNFVAKVFFEVGICPARSIQSLEILVKLSPERFPFVRGCTVVVVSNLAHGVIQEFH